MLHVAGFEQGGGRTAQLGACLLQQARAPWLHASRPSVLQTARTMSSRPGVLKTTFLESSFTFLYPRSRGERPLWAPRPQSAHWGGTSRPQSAPWGGIANASAASAASNASATSAALPETAKIN